MENNNFLEMLMTRRSIRSYTDKPVSDETVNTLLAAGCNAPSGQAIHPCHFIVIDDKEKKQELTEIHGMANFLEQSPLAIVVCGDVTRSWAMWRDDCAAATMNIIMAAEAIGLSSCWCGVYPRDRRVDAFSKALGIPASIMPYSIIALGYSDAPKKLRNKLYEDRIHRQNAW